MDSPWEMLHVELQENLEPSQLNDLIDECKKVASCGDSKGIVISGRLPVWAYSALVHFYHPRPFVATFDPRLGGAVVVESHVRGINIGDVISVSENNKKIVVNF